MDDGHWLIAVGCRRESSHTEPMLKYYFRNFTDLHPSKASFPTETFFSELSMMTSRFLQFLNANTPMFVTLEGIFTLVNALQSENA